MDKGAESSYLYGVVLDVEVAGRAAQVGGVEVAGSLLEADHAGLVQFAASLHHQVLTVELQTRVHLGGGIWEKAQCLDGTWGLLLCLIFPFDLSLKYVKRYDSFHLCP